MQKFMQIVCVSAGVVVAASLLFAESPALFGLVMVVLLVLVAGSAWLHRLGRHGGRLRGGRDQRVRVIKLRRMPPQVLPNAADGTEEDDELPLV